ncbi:MAG: hypothetical protein KAS29_18065, partial [Bacteroidales bacterium]|nr:hypothetical protein [Bacteroidales bacterium]
MMNFFRFFKTVLFASFLALFISCGGDKELPVALYYEYDQDLPLLDSVRLLTDTTDYSLFYLTYQSVHDKKVTGLLTLPGKSEKPLPCIIL